MIKKISIVCLTMVLISCNRQSTDLFSFEIEKAFSNEECKSIGDIASEVSYIRLETNDKCIVGNNPKAFASDNYIVVIASGRIMLFERKTGVYIGDIGNKGNGPEEYNHASIFMPVNYGKNRILAIGNQNFLEYGYNGKCLREVLVTKSITNTVMLDEYHYVSFFPNYEGNNKTKVSVFALDGNEIVNLPNYQVAPSDGGSFSFWMPNAWFFQYNDEVFFTELFNDTVYTVKTSEIAPRMVLGLGHFLPPYEQQNSSKLSSGFTNKYFMLRNMFESDRYIFYSFKYKENIYTAVYDKKMSVSALSKNGGFYNNIDNFISIPLSSINISNELVGVIYAHEIVQWFKSNKSTNLAYNLELFKNVSENDNPIIAIAKLKK